MSSALTSSIPPPGLVRTLDRPRVDCADGLGDQDFLSSRVEGSGRTWALAAVVSALAWVAMIPADWEYVEAAAGRVLAGGLRLLAGGVLVAAAVVLWRRPAWLSPLVARRLATAATAWLALAFLAVFVLRDGGVGMLDTSAVLFGTAVMVLVPIPLGHRLTIVASFYLGFYVVGLGSADVDPVRLGTNLVIAAVGGALCAMHLETGARRSFELALRLAQSNDRLHLEVSAGEAVRAALARQASEDALTGVLNRRSFLDRACTELERAVLRGEPSSVVLLDVDRFKAINDTHGHGVGDDVLVELAAGLRSALRAGDLIGRFGGEEFAVFLPRTDADWAHRIAERLRTCTSVVAESVEALDRLTISLGVAEVRAEETVIEAVARADAAMYRAKRAGGDRLALAPS